MKDLEDKGFLDLFENHRELWETKAQEAYDYAKNLVTPAGEPVSPDDVLPLLVPALVLAEEFRDFLEDKQLTRSTGAIFSGSSSSITWEDLEADNEQEGNG